MPLPDTSTFSDVFSFFRGLFTGDARMEDAYFISFFLYFIIFLAVYMEGLSRIPIFGEKGKINKSGKVFAVAASGLSTFALFLVDTITGIPMTERLSYLVSPWGVWGGVLIAGIIAYMTFSFLHKVEGLKEETAFVMAVAASVGVVFAGFLLTMENVIGWGFLLMLLVFLIAGIYKLFFTEEKIKTRKDEHKNDVEKEVERYKKEDAERAVRRARERMEHHLLHPRSSLLEAIEHGEELAKVLARGKSGKNHHEAEHQLKKLKKHLHNAAYGLKRARSGEKGDVFAFLDNLYAHTGAALSLAEKLKLPAHTDAEWDRKVAEIIAVIHNKIRPLCGEILKRIDDFIEKEKREGIRAQEEHREQQEREEAQEAAEERAEEQAHAQTHEPTHRGRVEPVVQVRRKK